MNDQPSPIPFVPISRQLLDSSVWETDLRVRVLWITMLMTAAEPARRGTVDMTIRALSGRAAMSPDDVRYALNVLESPDHNSRTPGADGRRIERIDSHREWGWRILNWKEYEEGRERMLHAARQARYKARKGDGALTVGDGEVTPADLEGEVEVEVEVEVDAHTAHPADERRAPDGFDEFWSVYPRRVGKGRAINAWRRMSVTQRNQALGKVRPFASVWASAPEDRRAFIPHPTTWLSQKRWEDDPADWQRQAKGMQAAPSRPAPIQIGAHKSERPTRDIEDAPDEIRELHARLRRREATDDEVARLEAWVHGGAN